MSPELLKVIWTAIRGWPEMLRLCLIVVVLVTTTTVCLYFTKAPALPIALR